MVNQVIPNGNDFDILTDKVDFNQIYFQDWQRDHIFLWAKPYYNSTLTPFFENQIISELVMVSNAEKISICSWALKQKMTARIPPRRDLTPEVLEEDFDVMSFSKNAHDHDMLGALDVWHPGCSDILRKIWANLGYKMPQKPKFPIYQNHFCATREVYREYVVKFLIPAMNLMTWDDEIRKLCYQDANYTRTTLNIPVDFDRIEKFLGIRHYPLHPFLLERCFSLWIDDKNLKVVYL